MEKNVGKLKQARIQLPKLAEYLNAQINVAVLSGIRQKDIATAMGYTRPNIVTMFKQGLTKLPIEKVGPLAGVLGIDPVYLLRIVMNDYMPETYDAVTRIFGGEPITEHEREIVAMIRVLSGGTNPDVRTGEAKDKLAEFVKALS